MNELHFWSQFMLAILATWRLTHLLAKEDGPADIFVRLRRWVGDGFFGQVLDCFYCLSLWVAAPIAFTVSHTVRDLVLVWLALSGAACLLERSGREPVVIQPLPDTEEGGIHHGMLRSETNRHESGLINSKDDQPDEPKLHESNESLDPSDSSIP